MMAGVGAVSAWRLSELLGDRVRVDGHDGRIRDVGVRLGAARWEVVALRLAGGGEERDVDVADGGVRVVERGRLAVEDRPPPVAPEAWLRAEVLDREVIDVDGREVVRVGDVVIELGDGALAAVALELGAAPVARRLGLGPIARRLRERVVPVAQVHLPGATGALELDAPRARLAQMAAADVADILERLSHPRADAVLADLDPTRPNAPHALVHDRRAHRRRTRRRHHRLRAR